MSESDNEGGAVKSQLMSVVLLTAIMMAMLLPSQVMAQQHVRVAVFKGGGVGSSVGKILQALQQDEDEMLVSRITPDQIRQGELKAFDVLVHPGGSGSGQGKSLGAEGRKEVRDFVNRGGGYLGVCAGSYLATNDYSWSLNLIDAKVVDRRHWARGTGRVKIQLSPTGMSFFDHAPDELEIHYGQGPLLGRREWDDLKVPDYQSLAIYKTEIAEKGAPRGIMPGTSAIVRSRFGSGRVFCFSPHPEMTSGRESMLVDAVLWLAGSKGEQVTETENPVTSKSN